MSTMPPDDGAERFADDAQRYRLESRIATGGMGEVWRATDTTLGRLVAVKLLKHEYADDASFRSRFETEARHAASLHHPGVAAVYDFGEAAPADGSGVQRPFLVMELVDGQPLSALLRGEPMDPDVVRDVLAQAAEALGAAHAAGIVHRDVKPANLMVTPDREVKITDFGIARAADGVGLTQTGQVMGTPQYLSPEQAAGATATPASDVYSLGCVAFECLAGARPFVRDSPIATALAHLRDDVPELPASVPADLANVVRRALAKKPEDRFPDAHAFAAALRDPASVAPMAAAAGAGAGAGADAAGADDGTQVLTGLGAAGAAGAAGATDPTPTPVPAPAGRRRRVPWLIVGTVVAILVAVIGVIAFATGGDDATPTDLPTKHSSQRSSAPSAPTSSTVPSSTAPSSTAPTAPSSSATSASPTGTPSTTPTTSATPSTSPTPTTSSSPAAPSSSAAASQPPSSSASPASSTDPSPSASTAPSADSSPAAFSEGKAAR